jgi:hypothetical protein
MWISEETVPFALHNINRLVFVTEVVSVYCAVQAESYIIWIRFVLKGLHHIPNQLTKTGNVILILLSSPNHAPLHNSQCSSAAALLDTKPASTRNLSSILSLQLNLPYFIEKFQSVDLQLLSRPHTF